MMKFSKRFKQCKNFKERVCCLYLGFTRFLISVSKVNQIHLGTQVIYNDKKMYVSDGTMYLSDGTIYPKWKLRECQEVKNYVYATEEEFKKILNLKNIENDSMSWWKWYCDSWLDIDYRAMANGEELCSVRILGKDDAHGKRRR